MILEVCSYLNDSISLYVPPIFTSLLFPRWFLKKTLCDVTVVQRGRLEPSVLPHASAQAKKSPFICRITVHKVIFCPYCFQRYNSKPLNLNISADSEAKMSSYWKVFLWWKRSREDSPQLGAGTLNSLWRELYLALHHGSAEAATQYYQMFRCSI